jgi:hypothetical protein
MNQHDKIKLVAIGFAKFLDEECFRSFRGWCLNEALDDEYCYEYQLDELYDYWRTKVINESETEP